MLDIETEWSDLVKAYRLTMQEEATLKELLNVEQPLRARLFEIVTFHITMMKTIYKNLEHLRDAANRH